MENPQKRFEKKRTKNPKKRRRSIWYGAKQLSLSYSPYQHNPELVITSSSPTDFGCSSWEDVVKRPLRLPEIVEGYEPDYEPSNGDIMGWDSCPYPLPLDDLPF